MIAVKDLKLAHREIIKPINKGRFIGNYQCHVNSLSYAKRNIDKCSKILGCAQVFSDGGVVAHFVVKLKNGDIIDPTYGNVSENMYSYLIVIESYNIDTFKPTRELTELKLYLYSRLPWYKKLFTNKNNI